MTARHRALLTRRASPTIRLIQRIRRQYLQVFAFTGAVITRVFALQRWLGGDQGSAMYLLSSAALSICRTSRSGRWWWR